MGADTSDTALPRVCAWLGCTRPGHYSAIRIVFKDPRIAAKIDTPVLMCHHHGQEFASDGLMDKFLAVRLPKLESEAGSKVLSLALWVGVKCLARVGLQNG